MTVPCRRAATIASSTTSGVVSESPAKIPFHRLETTKTVVNQGDAAKLGIPLSPEVVKEADSVVGGTPSP